MQYRDFGEVVGIAGGRVTALRCFDGTPVYVEIGTAHAVLKAGTEAVCVKPHAAALSRTGVTAMLSHGYDAWKTTEPDTDEEDGYDPCTCGHRRRMHSRSYGCDDCACRAFDLDEDGEQPEPDPPSGAEPCACGWNCTDPACIAERRSRDLDARLQATRDRITARRAEIKRRLLVHLVDGGAVLEQATWHTVWTMRDLAPGSTAGAIAVSTSGSPAIYGFNVEELAAHLERREFGFGFCLALIRRDGIEVL